MDCFAGGGGDFGFGVEGVVDGTHGSEDKVEDEEIFEGKGEFGFEDIAVVAGFGEGFDIGADEGLNLVHSGI